MSEVYQDNWINLEEAAAYMGVTKDTVRNWIKKTDIPAHKVGKLWKFKRSELMSGLKAERAQSESVLWLIWIENERKGIGNVVWGE